MNSFKILTEDILALIYQYFTRIGAEDFAQKLEKFVGMNLKDSKTPLAKKNLKKIIKFYVKNNEKLQQDFITYRTEQEEEEGDEGEEEEQVEEAKEEEEQEVQEEVEEKPKKKKSKKDKKTQNGEDSAEVTKQEPVIQDEIETPKLRAEKKNKKRKSEQILEEAAVKPNGAAQKQQPEAVQEEPETENPATKKVFIETKKSKLYRTNGQEQQEEETGQGRKFFQRCDDTNMDKVKQELKDNSFSAKFKYGKGDEFGVEGYKRLQNKQGKEFKKEKGKLKNKAFFAGSIDMNAINSIKL